MFCISCRITSNSSCPSLKDVSSTDVVSSVSVVAGGVVDIASGGVCIIPASRKISSTNAESRPAFSKVVLASSISSDLVNPEFTAVVFTFDSICPISLLGKTPVVVNVVSATLIGVAMSVSAGIVGTSS